MTPTRREFLIQTAAVSLGAAIPVQVGQTGQNPTAPETPRTALNMASKALPHVKVVRQEETTRRLGGYGDCFHMSWAADDRQFVAVNDGTGWVDQPKGLYNTRLFAMNGGPHDATFQDVPGYPDLMVVLRTEDVNRYYGFGTLALDGRIYQFLGTPNHQFMQPGGRFIGAKIIYSPDNGRTWCNQDGSTPVVWETWERRSRQTMVFFEEPQDAFSLPSVLQMGRSYEQNRDGYVYVYAPNGNTDGSMNELVMFRVPKAQLLDRSAYEYFASRRLNGEAAWVKDIHGRGIVHTFPRGWVNTGGHPWAWMPSVVYNAPLDVYLMVSWGTGVAVDGAWFGKPSYLGFWMAPQPWGPWTQIHEETAWMPAHDPAARAYSPQIAPKWIAADGKSFWLVWTDFQKDEAAARQLREKMKQISTLTPDDQLRLTAEMRRIQPYYSFNAQCVDLVIEP